MVEESKQCTLKGGAHRLKRICRYSPTSSQLRVIDHDEEHGLFAELLVFHIALAPFFNTKPKIVCLFLGNDGALMLGRFRATCGVRQK
jgi:hypothetical protein